jgi:hypothetical protein
LIIEGQGMLSFIIGMVKLVFIKPGLLLLDYILLSHISKWFVMLQQKTPHAILKSLKYWYPIILWPTYREAKCRIRKAPGDSPDFQALGLPFRQMTKWRTGLGCRENAQELH